MCVCVFFFFLVVVGGAGSLKTSLAISLLEVVLSPSLSTHSVCRKAQWGWQRWPTSGPARKFMSAMLQGTYNGRAFTRTAASQVQCLSNTLPNIIAVMCNCKHCLLVWFPRGSLRPNPLCAVHRMLQGNSLFLSGWKWWKNVLLSLHCCCSEKLGISP